MKLIQDWKQAWKWFSVHGLLAIAFLQLLWPEVPPEIKAQLPDAFVRWTTLALTAITLWGRLVQQQHVPPDGSSEGR